MVASQVGADRGVSELIGMVLLIGLVLVGSATVVVLGSSALGDATDRSRIEVAQAELGELATSLETVAVGEDATQVRFDTSRSLAGDYQIDRSSHLNVTVNENGTCSFQQPLPTVRHEDGRGRTVAYQAGSVWRAGLDGSSAARPPAVTFEAGRLGVRLVNLTGHVDQNENVVRLNASATADRSRSIRRSLNQGECDEDDPTHSCETNVKTLAAARAAGNDNITIYTVGFGQPGTKNEELLTDVANATGGRTITSRAPPSYSSRSRTSVAS